MMNSTESAIKNFVTRVGAPTKKNMMKFFGWSPNGYKKFMEIYKKQHPNTIKQHNNTQ